MAPSIPLPLTALRAFDAVARLGGVGRAAETLGVTHGAISRQVGLLEQRLGQALLEGPRNARRLTGAGRALAAEIAPAFARLEAAMERRVAEARPLVVSCLSTLAARWLIPRLQTLSCEAGTAVEPRESYAALTADLEGCDLAIRMLSPGDPVPKGLIATPFMASEAGLVLAPGLDRPARRLLSRSHPQAWTGWEREASGWTDARPPLTFDHQQTMIEAAIAGLGAAIAQRPLVAADIAAGRLGAPLGFRGDDAVFAVFTRTGGRRAGVGRLIAGLRREGGLAS